MQSTARGTDVRRRGSASAIQHLADRTFGKVAELSSQVTEDVETALAVIAVKHRRPPEDGIRVPPSMHGRLGDQHLHLHFLMGGAHAHLLSRVTWVDETTASETPLQFCGCYAAGASCRDEERRLQRHHDWYFRPGSTCCHCRR